MGLTARPARYGEHPVSERLAMHKAWKENAPAAEDVDAGAREWAACRILTADSKVTFGTALLG